jgi:hypothetical protein
MNNTHPNMWVFIACFQGGLAKEEGTEDIGYAGTNRQSLLDGLSLMMASKK